MQLGLAQQSPCTVESAPRAAAFEVGQVGIHITFVGGSDAGEQQRRQHGSAGSPRSHPSCLTVSLPLSDASAFCIGVCVYNDSVTVRAASHAETYAAVFSVMELTQ